jgi:predicted acylesterase/phospholipase RssA
MRYTTKLRWKITSLLSDTSPDYSKATKFFNILSGNSIARDIGGGFVSQFLPNVLSPTTVLHDALQREKLFYGFEGKKFPYDIVAKDFLFEYWKRVNFAIHIYNNSFVVLTVELDEFIIDDEIPDLLELRDLKSYPSLFWLARRILKIVLTGKSVPDALSDVPSILPCICIASDDGLSSISHVSAVEALTGHRQPSKLIVESVISANALHQTVDNGLLLIDKQGIFFTFPISASPPGKYGPLRIFDSTCASLEFALVAAHFLSSINNCEKLNADQVETLVLMVTKSNLAMPKSVSAQRCWSVLSKAFYLPDLLEKAELKNFIVHAPVPIEKKKREMALIMKGGGVKGLALAGAVFELQKNKYNFNTYVGTSAGSIAAILLAAGFSGEDLKDLLEKKNFNDFVNENIFYKIKNLFLRGGWNSGLAFRSWMHERLLEKLPQQERVRMASLPCRAVVYASNADKGTVTFDSEGDNSNTPAEFAARCSMSIPFFFIAESHHGFPIFDGGLLNNYPVKIFLDSNPDLDFVALYLVSEKSSEYLNGSMVGNLIDIFTGRDEKYVADFYKDKTILIDPSPIKTTDFIISQDEKNFLLSQGRLAAMQFINDRNPSQKLHSEIVGLTKKVTELKSAIKSTRKIKYAKIWTRRVVIVVLFFYVISFYKTKGISFFNIIFDYLSMV